MPPNLHLWISLSMHRFEQFHILNLLRVGIVRGVKFQLLPQFREISVVASISNCKKEIQGNRVKERESCKIPSVANCKLYVYYLGRKFLENFL